MACKRETKIMKRTITLLSLSLMFLATVALALSEDEGRQRRLPFTQGPNITNISGESATMNQPTNANRDLLGAGQFQSGRRGNGRESWSLKSSRARGTTPVYRLVSAQGDALLTTDPNERNSAIDQGYQDQGITGYIATSQLRGTVPLFRFYNAGTGQHIYTTSWREREQALRSGMNDEGVTGYVWQ
jgi:hypothetical protein